MLWPVLWRMLWPVLCPGRGAVLLPTGGTLGIRLRPRAGAPSLLWWWLVVRTRPWVSTERIGAAEATARHAHTAKVSVDRTASPESSAPGRTLASRPVVTPQ